MKFIYKNKIFTKNFGFKSYLKRLFKDSNEMDKSKNKNVSIETNTIDSKYSNLSTLKHDSKEINDSSNYNSKETDLEIKNNNANIKHVQVPDEGQIYKNLYNRISPFNKDPDYGIINTYELNEDKGLEVYKDSKLLVNRMSSINENSTLLSNNENKSLEKIKEQRSSLSLIVYEKLKKYNSNYKQEYQYNLSPNEEKWYKEIIFDKSKSDNELYLKSNNKLKIKKNEKPKNKNHFDEIEENVRESYPEKFLEEISTPFEKYIDSFNYMSDKNSKFTKQFLENEKNYSNIFLSRFRNLYGRLLDEIRIEEESMCPINLNDDIMVFNKKYDHFTLYCKYNAEKTISPNERGKFYNTTFYEYIDGNKNQNILKISNNTNNADEESEKNKNNEIYEIFGIRDLTKLMSIYDNIEIIEYVKDILDRIESGEVFGEGILKTFYISPNSEYLIILTTNELSSSYNMIIKDLKKDVIIPVIFKNVDISISFDKHGGIYYTEIDKELRPSKVFRHQIGIINNEKRIDPNNYLVYHEKNSNFKLRTFNCNSNDYVYLEIYTGNRIMTKNLSKYNKYDFYDKCNEIWYLDSSVNVLELKDQEFQCLKKIENSIYYLVKYSRLENSFYLLQNVDKSNKFINKLIKINLDQLRYIEKSDFKIENENRILKVNNSNNNDVSSKNMNINNSSSYEYVNDESNNLKELREVKSLSELQNKSSKISNFNLKDDVDIRNTSKIRSLYDIFTKYKEKDEGKDIDIEKKDNIIDFHINENYLITHELINENLISNSSNSFREIFNIKNLKSNKSYIMEVNKNLNNQIDYTLISKIQYNYNYKGSYLYFTQSSLAKPLQILNLSLGTQINYKIHQNFILDEYSSETIYVNVGDNTQIPVLMYYNSQFQKSSYLEMIKDNKFSNIDNLDEYIKENKINLNKIIIFSESSLDKSVLEFNINYISLLNRGFTLCFPITRGSLFLDNDWYLNGIKNNKYFNVTDFIEVCAYLKDKKLTSKLILYSSHLGSITSMITIINSSNLIDLAIFFNGVFDLIDLLKTNKSNKAILDKILNNKADENEIIIKKFREEFGNPNVDIEAYNRIKEFSPYQLYIENRKNVKYPKMIFFTTDSFEYSHHTFKMVSRLRNKNFENSLFEVDPKFNLLYYDLNEEYESYEEKMCLINSIIIGEMNIKI